MRPVPKHNAEGVCKKCGAWACECPDELLEIVAGERRFREHPDWAAQFSRNAAVLTGREVIRVDVEKYTIAY